MDEVQTDHLKAYGAAYFALTNGVKVEWLLYYRGGSFLMPYTKVVADWCKQRGVLREIIGPAEVQAIYATIEESNMDRVVLEKAPKIAVYIPPTSEPWDDAVSLALEYAEIPYDRIWDDDVLSGELYKYDWVHLHHEDFSGQYGKFYRNYRAAPWYQAMVKADLVLAKRLGYDKAWKMKHAVALEIKRYVEQGGLLFAMCSAPITLDIALSALDVDIIPAEIDGDGIDPNYQDKLDFSRTIAFEKFHLIPDIYVYEHSDVDVTEDAIARGQNSFFVLQEFSAKYDYVSAMLVQNHTKLIREFLGQDTGFRRKYLKRNVVILGLVPGTDEAKYIRGELGKGAFAYLGGHDPEQFVHYVGDKPTNLSEHKNSPGYRLILNNVLFPAARKKKLKT